MNNSKTTLTCDIIIGCWWL